MEVPEPQLEQVFVLAKAQLEVVSAAVQEQTEEHFLAEVQLSNVVPDSSADQLDF